MTLDGIRNLASEHADVAMIAHGVDDDECAPAYRLRRLRPSKVRKRTKRHEVMQSLTSFRNRHEGEIVLVCSCGESLNELRNPERFLTIGVNDVGRRFQPDYLVVVSPRSRSRI